MGEEPFMVKHSKSPSMQNTLKKLSEALIELNLTEKNLDEKVLMYILNNLA
jgi:hypothetical protein